MYFSRNNILLGNRISIDIFCSVLIHHLAHINTPLRHNISCRMVITDIVRSKSQRMFRRNPGIFCLLPFFAAEDGESDLPVPLFLHCSDLQELPQDESGALRPYDPHRRRTLLHKLYRLPPKHILPDPFPEKGHTLKSMPF